MIGLRRKDRGYQSHFLCGNFFRKLLKYKRILISPCQVSMMSTKIEVSFLEMCDEYS